MKTIQSTLNVLALILSTALFGQGTIPNQDFEGWISGTHPKNWETTTQMLPAGYVTCQRTTNSHSGTYAIELTTIDMEGWAVPGVITLGELGIGYTAGGIGFSDKPEALKGFLRHPSQGDVVMVSVQFYKEGNEIGGGFWSTGDSIPDYQEFTVPISFNSSADPDTMNITILTDQNQPGSKLFIDGLHFEYTSTGMQNIRESQGIKVYPNPCRDMLTVGTDDGQPLEASLYDLLGREVARATPSSGSDIDTSTLPEGIYVVLVRSPLGIFQEKVLKQ